MSTSWKDSPELHEMRIERVSDHHYYRILDGHVVEVISDESLTPFRFVGSEEQDPYR